MKNLSKVSRREFVTLAAAGLTLAGSRGLFALDQKEGAAKARPPISADEALRQLIEGNATVCERATRESATQS